MEKDKIKSQKKLLKEIFQNEIRPYLLALKEQTEKGAMDTKELLNTLISVHREGNTLALDKDRIFVVKGDKGDLPIKGKDYFTEEEKKEFLKAITPVVGKDYFKKSEITAWLKQTTPKAGKDYFTAAEQRAFLSAVTPKKGKDYFTKQEVDDITATILSKAKPIKGVHYTDGKPGEKGADGTKITAEQVRNLLETLVGHSRLKMKAIDGLEEALMQRLGDGGIGGSGNTTINQNTALETGVITFWPGTAAQIPTTFLRCNGQAVSRTTYAALFAVISTRYGTGNGTTTFNVPDMRSYFPVGADSEVGSLPSSTINGSDSNSYTCTQHSHQVSGSTDPHQHSFSISGTTNGHTHEYNIPSLSVGGTVDSHSHDLSGLNTGGPNETCINVDNDLALSTVNVAPYNHTHFISGSTGSAAPNFTGSTSCPSGLTTSSSTDSYSCSCSTSDATAGINIQTDTVRHIPSFRALHFIIRT